MDNHLIWEVLLSNGTITHDQLSDALRWQRSHPDEDVGSILLARGIVTDGQLLAAYAQRLDVPFIEKDLVVKRPEVLKLVPETLARRYGIMPLDINNNKILVAISDPEDMSVIEDVKLSSRMDASIALASAENIQGAIERYYRNAELFYREEQEEVQTVNFVSDDTAKKMDEIESSVNNTPVVKLVNNLVQQAYIRQASDIHIEPFENDVIVRMRIDGDLIEVMRLAPATLASVISRIKILSGMNIAEKRIPQDGRFNYTNDEFKVDLRVSTIPTMYGEKCVMRLLNTGGENLLSFEQLGMSRETIARFDHMLSAPNGIILVTGPTGSGKSTTLHFVNEARDEAADQEASGLFNALDGSLTLAFAEATSADKIDAQDVVGYLTASAMNKTDNEVEIKLAVENTNDVKLTVTAKATGTVWEKVYAGAATNLDGNSVTVTVSSTGTNPSPAAPAPDPDPDTP